MKVRTLLPLAALAFAAACADNATIPNTPTAGPAHPRLTSGSGAGFTSVDETVDGPGHCANGNPNTNCNIYDGKQVVWLNGGPTGANLANGSYFFAVLAPSGQNDPNDGGANNLSDQTTDPWPAGSQNADASIVPSGDDHTNRTFTVTNGVVSYGGTHTFDNASGKIRLMPYDDTPNGGGVYILAICSLAAGYPANPSACKYDAFKIQSGNEGGHLEGPTILKNAAATYDRTYAWDISKAADKTLFEALGGSVTINYTVVVHHDSGSVSNAILSGKITVFNPNTVNITIDSITDVLSSASDTRNCTVTGATAASLNPGPNIFDYSCTVSGSDIATTFTNTANVFWSAQTIDGNTLDAGSDNVELPGIQFTAKLIDECVAVNDSYAGSLGTVCVGDANPTQFKYTRPVTVQSDRCLQVDNTATFTTNDSGTTGSDSKTVQVCGSTGGLTIGFWQGPNGYNLIKTYSSAALRDYLRTFNPFKDLSSSASGKQVADYVSAVIAAAKCSDTDKTCNTMLRAQMLATALNVFYTGPGFTNTQISGVKAPSAFLLNTNLGGINIDLTTVCFPILAGPSCGGFVNASSAFGGATSKTVQQALDYASSQATPNTGLTSWYGQVKATQVLAKDVFDAINNHVAFVAP